MKKYVLKSQAGYYFEDEGGKWTAYIKDARQYGIDCAVSVEHILSGAVLVEVESVLREVVTKEELAERGTASMGHATLAETEEAFKLDEATCYHALCAIRKILVDFDEDTEEEEDEINYWGKIQDVLDGLNIEYPKSKPVPLVHDGPSGEHITGMNE